MTTYSNWKEDLIEVIDTPTTEKKAEKKIKETKVKNKVVINPTMKEAVAKMGGKLLEVKEVDDKKDTAGTNEDPQIKSKEKRAGMIKRQVLLKKLQAVRAGGGADITAGYEPEGEMVESNKPEKDIDKINEKKRKNALQIQKVIGEASAVLDANTKISNKEKRDKDKKELASLEKELKLRKQHGSNFHPYLHREEGEVNEGIMKMVKKVISGKKRPAKKAEMDKTTEKLHDLRKDKFKTDKQKEHEKYVNFMPHDAHHESFDIDPKSHKAAQKKTKMRNLARNNENPNEKAAAEKKAGGPKLVGEGVKGVDNAMRRADAEDRKAGKKTRLSPSAGRANVAKMIWDIKNAKENAKARGQNEEVVTELNRFGKETGKATGSLNKRPGSPVATSNQPGSAVNIVRRMIRKDTGRPEGQQKKVKGSPTGQQPGDRKLTPAQTISRMRAQVAAADAAMRDTRGT